jgi:hypothetical protein
MPGQYSFNDIIGHSLPFIGISFGIGLFFTLIYYFYSKILNDRIVESRAKAALFTVFETIAIFIIIFMFNGFFESLIFSAAGIPDTNGVSLPHLRLAGAVIDTFQSKINTVYISMIISEFVIQTIAQMTSVQIPMNIISPLASTGMGTTSISINTGEIFSIINNLYNSLIRSIIDIMLMTIARKTILDLAVPAIALILPLGLFLRGLYITKRTGSSLIALSLVLFYIYPLSLVFDGYLVRNYVPAIRYGDIVSDSSASFYYRNLDKFQPTDEIVPTSEENAAMTPSVGSLGSKDLLLAPSKYLGSIVLQSTAISTAGGFIKAAIALVPNRLLGFGLQFLTDLISGIMLLGVVNFVSLETYAFNTILIQAAIIMNILGTLLVTTTLDIIMCVTSYRIFADVFSGDKSITGLSKVL